MALRFRHRPRSRRKVGKLRSSGKSNQEARNKAKECAGVAVMLNKRTNKHKITVQPEGNRIMRLRMKFKKKTDILVA